MPFESHKLKLYNHRAATITYGKSDRFRGIHRGMIWGNLAGKWGVWPPKDS